MPDKDKARSWISCFSRAICCFQCEVLCGRSFDNSASCDGVGDETMSEVGEDQDLLLLHLFFKPWDHLNFCLPSQAPPAALTALPEQDLSLPELFEISPLKQSQWWSLWARVFGLVWPCTVQIMTWGLSHHLTFPPLPLSAWECSFCVHPSQKKYFPLSILNDTHPYTWKCSGPGWIAFWVLWCSGGCLYPRQRWNYGDI